MTVLWPVSQLYRCLVGTRRQMYRWGFLKSHRVESVVVVVGNVIAGGAGKTPTTIAIVQHLLAQNFAVGVISRGYGRNNDACLEVGDHGAPEDVGDEPLLIRQATQAPVFVARTRVAAARALLAQHPETQVIVCDDGLQHYALHRDIEVCVFDDRGKGNGWLLPAGPLREPWPLNAVQQAGQDADQLLVVHTGNRPAFAGFRGKRQLGVHAKRKDGSVIALASLAHKGSPPLLALAGIAQPESFFSMLRALRVPLQKTMALPDHYDFNSYQRNIYGGYQLICTEKDAQKLWPIEPDALAVPLVLTIEPDFFDALDRRIAVQLAAKLSLRHGHQTT